ncbi:hypothetical protein K461DRAFT_144354 [Myriangium duriaei CBS 260.36]|uniref:Uncharacterized protein n=1 Tax=Myriangium duriaei CBS 260.36 TaxID=1168546 RepID=A0A9P4J4J3_9PEZI|nr:hypothetical protein K461DRAFT_144354 [Myriangium duriaei CBS 260.36]
MADRNNSGDGGRGGHRRRRRRGHRGGRGGQRGGHGEHEGGQQGFQQDVHHDGLNDLSSFNAPGYGAAAAYQVIPTEAYLLQSRQMVQDSLNMQSQQVQRWMESMNAERRDMQERRWRHEERLQELRYGYDRERSPDRHDRGSRYRQRSPQREPRRPPTDARTFSAAQTAQGMVDLSAMARDITDFCAGLRPGEEMSALVERLIDGLTRLRDME